MLNRVRNNAYHRIAVRTGGGYQTVALVSGIGLPWGRTRPSAVLTTEARPRHRPGVASSGQPQWRGSKRTWGPKRRGGSGRHDIARQRGPARAFCRGWSSYAVTPGLTSQQDRESESKNVTWKRNAHATRPRPRAFPALGALRCLSAGASSLVGGRAKSGARRTPGPVGEATRRFFSIDGDFHAAFRGEVQIPAA
jgi:hypothetical protein